jgi:hypothetical protein
VAPKTEGSIFYFTNDLEPLGISLLKPTFQLSLGPVATSYQEDTAFTDQWQHPFAITLTQPSSLSVFLIAQGNGVKCSLVKHDIPTFSLLPVEHRIIRSSYEVPLLKLYGFFEIILCSRDLTRKGNTLRAVIDTKSTGGPVLFTEREEQGPVSAAEIEKCSFVVGKDW